MEDNKAKKYQKEKDNLVTKIGYLQRLLKEYKVPVMVVFEGVHASGKGRLSNELLLALDPRYTYFYATHTPTESELRRPFLWQYFVNIPSNSQVAIFYRSWYSLYIGMKNKVVDFKGYNGNKVLLKEMKDFEKTLEDDGTILIKFYVDISDEKRKEHLNSMAENPHTMWKAQEYDKANDDQYKEDIEELIKENQKTWHTVKYDVRERVVNEMLGIVADTLEKRVKDEKKKLESEAPKRDGFFKGKTSGTLEKYNKEDTLSKEEYKDKLIGLQKEMRDIQYTLYEKKIPLIIVYEGWDAAGKGGNIKRLVQQLDPTGYQINTTAAPTDIELRHHYLWRFWQKVPKTGHVCIYDRSWYGRVMVERVEGFATNKDVNRAYKEINDFEETLFNFGGIIIKFFINISKEEQLKRFEERQGDENKVWKITEDDWRNREKWDKYVESIDDMLDKTSTKIAPWFVISGNDKRYARIKTLEIIKEVCEQKLFDQNK